MPAGHTSILQLSLWTFFGLANASYRPSHGLIKRDSKSLNDAYDCIIIGGGTSGLVVANRLTEDPKKSVLVIEYGDIANTINSTVPFFTTLSQAARLYNYTSVPQLHLANRTSDIRLGAVVGGGSTVNGMAWDRGSQADYDSWESLGNPHWGWEPMQKYFRKSSTFEPPAGEYITRFGYEWNPDAYGDGPVKVGFPSWQWPEAELQAQSWATDLGVPVLEDGTGGSTAGLSWLPQNSGGKSGVRSSAETAYYRPVSNRTNLHLLVRHFGASVKLDDENRVKGVEIASRDEAGVTKFVRSKSVVLAAGTVNTPRILQLSGIGPSKHLESLGIKVEVDLPGVGANFHDHPSFYMVYNFTSDTAVNPSLMNNPEFYNASWDEYEANRTGPFTHAWGNRIVFASLRDLDPNYESIVQTLREQEPLDHLPPLYAEYPALVKGFIQQRSALALQFLDPHAGVVEFAFGGQSSVPVAVQKPLSRGTVLVKDKDPDPSRPPLIDFNSASNPVDMALAIRGLARARAFMAGDAVAALGVIELSPGPAVGGNDTVLEAAMRESLLSPTFDHPVGTAAMMPRDLGGVVDAELRVYGVDGLWVVDASVIPIVPAAHTQSTVYAVAERAADLIKSASS